MHQAEPKMANNKNLTFSPEIHVSITILPVPSNEYLEKKRAREK